MNRIHSGAYIVFQGKGKEMGKGGVEGKVRRKREAAKGNCRISGNWKENWGMEGYLGQFTAWY